MLRSSYHVSSSIIIHCHALHCSDDCFVFTVSSPPPLSPVDPAATADYTAAAYDYVVDDSTPTVELPGKQSHSPLLSHISPTYLYLSVALGICCCYVTFLFQMHSLSLSPLDYLSDTLCSLIYINIVQQ